MLGVHSVPGTVQEWTVSVPSVLSATVARAQGGLSTEILINPESRSELQVC